MVSIICITFNHERFIVQALESFLMQRTNFPFEVIVADDASTDNNQKIISEYASQFPEIIKPILREKNIGAINNWIDAYNKCTGRYIALCEGDDYWIDPLKLQKQFDFMMQNPDFSTCFHNALIIPVSSNTPPHLFCQSDQKLISSIEEVINGWFIPSSSMFFRHNFFSLPNWFKTIFNGDYALQLCLAHKGKIGYINEIMSVYRIGTGFSQYKKFSNYEVNLRLIEVYKKINIYTDNKYGPIINKKILSIEKDNKAIKRKNYLKKLILPLRKTRS